MRPVLPSHQSHKYHSRLLRPVPPSQNFLRGRTPQATFHLPTGFDCFRLCTTLVDRLRLFQTLHDACRQVSTVSDFARRLPTGFAASPFSGGRAPICSILCLPAAFLAFFHGFCAFFALPPTQAIQQPFALPGLAGDLTRGIAHLPEDLPNLRRGDLLLAFLKKVSQEIFFACFLFQKK